MGGFPPAGGTTGPITRLVCRVDMAYVYLGIVFFADVIPPPQLLRCTKPFRRCGDDVTIIHSTSQFIYSQDPWDCAECCQRSSTPNMGLKMALRLLDCSPLVMRLMRLHCRAHTRVLVTNHKKTWTGKPIKDEKQSRLGWLGARILHACDAECVKPVNHPAINTSLMTEPDLTKRIYESCISHNQR